MAKVKSGDRFLDLFFTLSCIMLWIWQLYNLNPRQDGFFCGCPLSGWGGGEVKKPPPYDLSDISYNDKTWHSYTLLKEVPKTIWIRWHIPWVLLISVFNKGNSINFVISRNTDIDFLESSTILLIDMVFWWCQQKWLVQAFLT